MSFRYTCSCGQLLRVVEGTTATKVACPKCRAVTAIADFNAPRPAALPAAIDPVAPKYVVPDLSVGPPAMVDDYDVPELVPDADGIIPVVDSPGAKTAPPPRKGKKQRKMVRRRREGLEKLSLGLALHIPAAFLFLPAMWMAWPALAMRMASGVPELSEAIAPTAFLEIASGVFLILASLADVPAIFWCLRLPDRPARGLLVGALCCKGLVVTFAVLLFFLESVRPTMLIIAVATAIASWILWMCFLRRVGRFLEKPEFSTEALQTMASGLKTLILTVALLFLVVAIVMLIVYVKLVLARWALFVISLTVFFAGIRVALAVGQADSVIGFFLAPTGVPYLMNRHLAMVGSMRMVIERRT